MWLISTVRLKSRWSKKTLIKLKKNAFYISSANYSLLKGATRQQPDSCPPLKTFAKGDQPERINTF